MPRIIVLAKCRDCEFIFMVNGDSEELKTKKLFCPEGCKKGHYMTMMLPRHCKNCSDTMCAFPQTSSPTLCPTCGTNYE